MTGMRCLLALVMIGGLGAAPCAAGDAHPAGYVAYSYPGFDVCPCGSDGCFHPAWYYCGGESYEKHWLRKWLRAHFAKGSMLEDYPCHCLFPPAFVPAVPPP